VCVEKDERSTDSRVKTGIQNILGGMVLGGLPLVATAVIVMWGTSSLHSYQLKQQGKQYDALLLRVVSLESFRFETDHDRFRDTDGERIESKVDRVSQKQHEYETIVEKLSTVVQRNTAIILNNQRKAHTHAWRGNSKEKD